MTAEPTRDRWGRPLITPPDGGKPVPYTRVTTVAKTLDDEAALAAWKMRMCAIGLARRPDLLALASATDDKRRLDDVTRQALDAAASGARANLGTALHAIIERVNAGLPDGEVLEALAADVAAYRKTVSALTISHPETFVVLDRWQVAGTFDFVVRHPVTGKLVVGDLKTGTDLSYSWRSIAVQLWAYANADAAYDPATGVRAALPDLDRTVGIVVHLPAGEGSCTIHEVDLVSGGEAFERAMWVRRWRARRDISTPLDVSAAMPRESAVVAQEPIVAGLPSETLDARKAWLKGRVDSLEAAHSGVVDQIRARWPSDVSRPLSTISSHVDLDRIIRIVDQIEGRLRAPFPDADDPGDGGPADPEEMRVAMFAWHQLDPKQTKKAMGVVSEAVAAGHVMSLRHAGTRRRLAQMQVIIAAATLTDLDVELCRHVLAAVTGTVSKEPLGAIIGALTITHAEQAWAVIHDLHAGIVAVSWTPDGQPTVTPTTNNNNNK
jgi:hypothetical protein